MTRTPLSLLLLAGLALAGSCRSGDRPPPPNLTAGGLGLAPPPQRNPSSEVETVVLLVRLQLFVLELPLGASGASEELWSYLNEEPLGGHVSAALGLNGVRVGLGRKTDYPVVRKILAGLTARSPYRWDFSTPPASPVTIPLRQTNQVQTIFLFQPDRTLRGRDYEPGENVLTLVPTINYDDPSAVHLSGALAIRSQPRPQYVERPAGAFALENRPTIHPLPEMDFRVVVPPEGFLFVGPSPEARRENSPGAAFLLSAKEGVKLETVLLISPRVFSTPVGKPD